MSYDSRADSYEHIAKVRGYVNDCAIDLLHRADVHDASKLVDPEKAMFDQFTPKLAVMTYDPTPGSEYQQTTAAMYDAGLRHHYDVNDHHPEHFEGGFADMNLLQVLEMLCDWKAAGERHADGGDIRRSIEMNADRFGYGPDVRQMLLNTVDYLGW